MSSEGSVSSGGSRIRQFGLYRSIDARTEEFLRLSRRRQIRQGCACAAISTAITVTVVVVVIFVYEFSLNSEKNLESSLRANWFSLINDTTGGLKTEYSKAGIDKTTLKILPVLLKALKNNVFLEKILEEQASTSPAYEEKETTEYTIDKNVFTKNWFRLPSSKFYAIAYKTSPMVYYKSHSKNSEYFTKIRKIRDYQRIINYVDKMISEKVYIGSTKPMMKVESFSEKSLTKALHKAEAKSDLKSKNAVIKPKLLTTLTSNKIKDKTINCKCPTKLGEVLNKILSGIERLLSVETSTEANTGCNQNQTEVNNKVLDIEPVDPEINESTLSTEKTTRIDYQSNLKQTTMNYEEDDVNTNENILTSNNKFQNYDSSTFRTNDHLSATVKNPKSSTKPIINTNKEKKHLNKKSVLSFFQKTAQLKDKKKHVNNYDEYDDSINSLHKLKRFEFGRDKGVQTNKVENLYQELSKNRKYKVFSQPLAKNKIFMNFNDAIYEIIEKEIPMPLDTSTALNKTTLTTQSTSTNMNNTNIKMRTEKNKKAFKIIVDEEAVNKKNSIRDDMFKTESSIDSPTETHESVTDITEAALWEELQNENVPAWKSMMPKQRPIYLDIQHRNDWKHEDPDFDLNIINNYDNIPDQ